MRLFKNKDFLLYLTSNSIRLFSVDRGFVAQQKFDSKDFNYLEIQNSTGYETSVRSFLESQNISQNKFVIVLSKELLYTKEFTSLGDSDETEFKQQFLESLPIESKLLKSITLKGKDETTVFATNGDNYLKIIDILNELKCKTSSVVPITLVDKDELLNNNDISKETLKNIVINVFKYEPQNLLNLETKVQKAEIKKETWELALIEFFLIIIVGLFLLYTYRVQAPGDYIRKYPPTDFSNKQSTQSTESENTYKTKEDLLITVLNGSRIPGHATQFKQVLTKAGFLNISTDNADEQNNNLTLVRFSTTIAPEQREEVLEALKQEGLNVEESTDPLTTESDIEIITGTQK